MQIIARKDAKRLGLKRYFTGKPCRNGHICERGVSTGHCMICNLARVKANYDPAKKSKYNKQIYLASPEKYRQRCRDWHARNRERRKEQRRMRRVADDTVRAKDRNREARYRRFNLQWRIKKALRGRLTRAIKKGYPSGSFVRDLGCSIDELIRYLAVQFTSEMSWDNWTRVWQVDHIKPLRMFDLANRQQFLTACHYTNLQPLLIDKHRKKTASEYRASLEAAE